MARGTCATRLSSLMVNRPQPMYSAGPRLAEPVAGDPAREAIASLRGYAYQLFASALAWIDLKSDEELYLEVAEDYAITAKDALNAVQVKDTGNVSVTINSEGVRAALNAFVDLTRRNPTRQIYVRFLTTSSLGQERELADRIGGTAALRYWRQAAAGADVAPLRELLLRLPLSVATHDYIAEKSDEDLREQFLKRIQFDCGRPPLADVERDLDDHLARYASDRLGVPIAEAASLTGHVLKCVLDTVVHATPRRLTDVHLRRLIEDATRVALPRRAVDTLAQAAANLIGAGQASAGAALQPRTPSVLESEIGISLPAILAGRSDVVRDVVARLDQHGAAVLTGSSGSGKTIVARLASRYVGGAWHLADFRNASATETAIHLADAEVELGSSQAAGIILDDLNESDDPTARTAVARFLATARRRDVRCLLTAYRQPSSRTLAELGLEEIACFAVPDLTVEEVGEMVTLAGGHAAWAQVIYMAGAFGHPQLVHALISGLRSRSWPADELKALRKFEASTDVQAERLAARRQLVAVVPDDAKALLYRVSLMIGRFDRATVLALGELSPKIAKPGEHLDLLIGPWVEQFALDQLRVSPLLAEAGADVLSPAEQTKVHRSIAEAFTKGRVLDIGKADSAFLHALRGKSETALMKFAVGIILADQNTRALIAKWVSGIRLHRTDRPIFADKPKVAVMLRIAQLLLLVHGKDADVIHSAWEALRREIAQELSAELRRKHELFALGKMLSDVSGAALLPDWIGLILRFSELIEGDTDMQRAVADPVVEGMTNPTVTGIMFIVQASGIRSVADLKAAFDRLDGLSAEARQQLFANALGLPSGFGLIVNHAWLEETKRGSMDWLAAARLYQSMAEQARRWGYRDIAIRCHIARGVMLDEYANEPDQALAVLDEAEGILGADPVLSRARAKIHYRRKDHAAALVLLRESADEAARNDPIEQAFMFREAGISAAETGNWAESVKWFEAARDGASKARAADMKVMAVGLRADHAVAAYQAGNESLALKSMAAALEELATIDPTSSRRAGYTHRVIRHALLCINLKVTRKTSIVPDQSVELVPGMCSNNEPPDLSELPLAPLEPAWYLLAEIDTVVNGAPKIVDLQERLNGRTIPMMEIELRHVSLATAIRRSDVDAFLATLGAWVGAVLHAERHAEEMRRQSVDQPIFGEVDSPPLAQLSSDGARFPTADSLLAFGMVASLNGREDALRNLVKHLSNTEMDNSLKELVHQMAGDKARADHVEGRLAAQINLVATRTDLQPDEVFVAALHMIQSIKPSNLKLDVAPILAKWLRSRLKYAISEQQFLMRNPSSSIPSIEKALEDTSTSLAASARLLLAAQDASTTRLAPEFVEYLRALSEE